MRILLISVGMLATALAVLGAILPGLPTTPFLLVALWAFARSSPRLHAWVQRMPLLRTALGEAERFEREGTMRAPVKVFALVMAWSSLALTSYLTGGAGIAFWAVVALVLTGTAFLIWIPTAKMAPPDPEVAPPVASKPRE